MDQKTVVQFDINLDDSISAIGLIVGDEEPAIEIGARFGKHDLAESGDHEGLFYLAYMASEQIKDYTFQVGDAIFDELRAEKIIVGPALIPNKLIFRKDPGAEGFFGYFPEEAVKNAAYSFQKHKLVDKFNINHNQKEFVDGVFLAETYIVKDPKTDQSRRYGYNLPKGSWFIKIKVENEELYNQLVSEGDMGISGFSIETLLLEKVIFNKQTN